MPRGKAYTQGQKEFMVTRKHSSDRERLDGETVVTQDAASRVAKGLPVSLRTVTSVLAEYHRTGNVASPSLPRGKPAFRISPPFETVIRHRIRAFNRTGQYLSIRSLRGWIYQEHHRELPDTTRWRALKSMGCEYGRSQRRSVFKERDDVIIARREYVRKT